MTAVPPGLLLLLVLLGAVLLVVLGWRLARAGDSRRARARARGGVRGEREAERLLERAGYTIEARNLAREARFVVDGEEIAYGVRIDLLARGPEGRVHVVEVKTGGRAPDPRHGPTRRQLLEYAMIFGTTGVLLVDMEAGEIHEVDFQLALSASMGSMLAARRAGSTQASAATPTSTTATPAKVSGSWGRTS